MRIKKKTLLQGIINFILLIGLSLFEMNISLFIINLMIVVLFLLVFKIFFSEHDNIVGIDEFLAVSNIYIILMVITSHLFNYNLGTILGASDAAKHYYQSMTLAGISDIYARPDGEIIGYTYLLSKLLLIADSVGSPSPYIGKLLNVYSGALIPILLANMMKDDVDAIVIKKIYKYIAFFPLVIYFSITLTRDITIMLMNTFFLYVIFKKNTSNLYKILLCIFIIIFSYFLRPEAGMFLILMIGAYYVFTLKNSNTITKVFIVSTLIIGFIFLSINIDLIFNTINHVSIMRSKYLNNILDPKSISYRVGMLPVPLNYIGRFAMALLGSFPPWNVMKTPFYGLESMDRLISISAKNLFDYGRIWLGIGVGTWYFWLPYFLLYTINKNVIKTFKQKYLLFFTLIYLFTTSIVTTEIGRVQVVYPYAVILSIIAFYNYSVRSRQTINMLMFIFIVVLSSVFYII